MDWESGCETAVGLLQTHRAVVPLVQQPAHGQGIITGNGGTPPGSRSEGNQPQPSAWEVVWVLRLYLVLQVQVEVVIGQRRE